MKISTIIIIIIAVLTIVAWLYINSRLLSSGDGFLPDSEVVERLTSMKIEVKDGITNFGDARMERRNGNIILHLKGNPYEMGYQHGKLLKDDIMNGVVPVFADPIGKLPEHRDKPALVKKLIMKYLEFSVYAPIERNTPHDYLKELRGIADGVGIDYRTIFIANFLSDLSMAMVPSVIGKKAKALGLHPECSDFAASRKATRDGKLIIGRNTDYSGQGRWMAHQTIFFYQPKGRYSYVKVSTAGMIKCNSAMNEKGIVVGGHFMGFEGSTPLGVSFTIFENEIMRRAASIDDALSILKKERRGGSFGLMISDGNTRDAVIVEAAGDRLGIRRMNRSTICLTNFATTSELKKVDLLTRHNIMMRDLIGRYRGLEMLIEKHRGKITPTLAAEFMGNHHDIIVGRERSVGFVVGNTINVTSVIFQPLDGFFWVATGSEPACINSYLGFDFRAEIRGEKSRVTPMTLKGYRWEKNSLREALRAYIEAYVVYLKNPHNTETIISILKMAREKAPNEPIFNRILAQIYIHRKGYERAIALLNESLDFPQSNNDKGIAYLHLGQAYDLMGKRDEALKAYQAVLSLRDKEGRDFLNGINDMVFGFAGKYSKEPFKIDNIKDIPIGFNLGSGLE